jgi:hypothetical protein
MRDAAGAVGAAAGSGDSEATEAPDGDLRSEAKLAPRRVSTSVNSAAPAP